MSMPSFFGSWSAAVSEGQLCSPCAACGSWAWWLPSEDLIPLCSRRECETYYQDERRAAVAGEERVRREQACAELARKDTK